MAHTELEALGRRETSFPESQPVLSALLLLSVDIIYWAALRSKRCSNYIYYSLLFLKSLIDIFHQEGFSANPL